MEAGIAEAAVVAVAAAQEDIPLREAQAWAIERKVSLTVFRTWDVLFFQVLFWSPPPQGEGLLLLPSLIYERLIDLEASPASVADWLARIGGAAPENE
jgi:hypothetical protein